MRSLRLHVRLISPRSAAPPGGGFLTRRPLSFLVVPQWRWCFDVLQLSLVTKRHRLAKKFGQVDRRTGVIPKITVCHSARKFKELHRRYSNYEVTSTTFANYFSASEMTPASCSLWQFAQATTHLAISRSIRATEQLDRESTATALSLVFLSMWWKSNADQCWLKLQLQHPLFILISRTRSRFRFLAASFDALARRL